MTQSVTGVQRYATELVKALDRMIERGELDEKELAFTLLAPASGSIADLNLSRIPVRRVGKLKGHLWEQLELPLYARKGLLLNLCNTSPMLKRNQVTTIHDAAVYAVPQTYSAPFRTWYKLLFAIARRGGSKRVVTVSEFSKEELVRYCGIPSSRIRTIYHGKEHLREYRADTAYAAELAGKRPFVLAVSSRSPNKNFGSIQRAYQLLKAPKFDIVVAGGAHPSVFAGMEQIGEGGQDGIGGYRYVGYVNDSQLKALYEQAACFVYPSFYEGFGLPPLEAMASGCPVIVSDKASLPEVCGDAALYCDPHKPEQLAEQLGRLMNDPQLREELRVKGLERANLYSWEKCSLETLATIREVLQCELPSSMIG